MDIREALPGEEPGAQNGDQGISEIPDTDCHSTYKLALRRGVSALNHRRV